MNYNLAQIENQIICDDAITEDGNGGLLNGNQWSRIVGDIVKYFDTNGEYNVLYNNQFFALIPSVTQLQANIQLWKKILPLFLIIFMYIRRNRNDC